MNVIQKPQLISQIIERLKKEVQMMTLAAQAAHEAATHEESKSEDQHDTRGLEASYLAGAQASRAEELSRTIQMLKELRVPKFDEESPIAPGALISVEVDERESLYFLIPEGAAGITLESAGHKVQVITTRSPIGEALLGRTAGEFAEVETGKKTLEMDILSVF